MTTVQEVIYEGTMTDASFIWKSAFTSFRVAAIEKK